MSRPRLAGAALAALLFLSLAARAEIEFIGVLLTPTRSTFALTEKPGQPATWHALGEKFAGYSLESFDAKTDTLTLTTAGTPPLRVRLKDDAKIKNVRLEIAGALTLGEKEKVEFPRATLLFGQENVFSLKDGLVWRITPTRMPDGNILYDAILDRTSPDGKVERVSSPRIVALPASPFSVKIGDIAFSFAPKPH